MPLNKAIRSTSISTCSAGFFNAITPEPQANIALHPVGSKHTLSSNRTPDPKRIKKSDDESLTLQESINQLEQKIIELRVQRDYLIKIIERFIGEPIQPLQHKSVKPNDECLTQDDFKSKRALLEGIRIALNVEINLLKNRYKEVEHAEKTLLNEFDANHFLAVEHAEKTLLDEFDANIF